MPVTVLPVQKLKESIGEEKTTDWIEISQDRINRFADCTEDRQFMHVDPELAKKGPFGTTVAHGFLTLALLTPLSTTNIWVPEGTKSVINYGFNKIRFFNPVPSGSRIRSVMKLAGVEEKENGRVLVTMSHTVSAEGSDKPALVAEWLFMFIT